MLHVSYSIEICLDEFSVSLFYNLVQLPIEPSYQRSSSGTCGKTITQSECEYIGRSIGVPFNGPFRSDAPLVHPNGCYMVTDNSDSDYGLWFNTRRGSLASCSSSRSCFCLKGKCMNYI